MIHIHIKYNNMSSSNFSFIIEPIKKADYFNSLIMSLFFIPSQIEHLILNSEPKAPMIIYLQELIKTKYIDIVRNQLSLNVENISEIMTFFNYCGWKNNTLDIFEHQKINLFYEFIVKIFNVSPIEIIDIDINLDIDNEYYLEDVSGINKIKKIPYLHFKVNKPSTDIKSLYEEWKSNNQKIINIPKMVSIYIDRTEKQSVDIQERIRLIYNMGAYNTIKWEVQSIICFNEEKQEYYAIIREYSDKWLFFSENCVPCLSRLDIKNKEIAEIIKIECVFIIYQCVNF